MAMHLETDRTGAARKLRQIAMPPVYRPSQRRTDAPVPPRAPSPGLPLVVERRHVSDGIVVEIRGAEPDCSGHPEDLHASHYLACVMPSPGGADVPGRVQVANDMVFVPAGHPCRRTSPKSRGRHLCLRLQPDFLDAVLPPDTLERPLAPRTDLVGGKLRHLLDGIAAELEAPGCASDLLIRSLCQAATVELGRCLMASGHGDAPAAKSEQRVVDLVRAHLQAGLDQPMSLGTLAAECGIGVRHLSRIFRKATGMTISHCLAVARIEHAKRLLCSTSVMIKEVSWRCGFREQAAFTTAFRKATGLSPSAFRYTRTDAS